MATGTDGVRAHGILLGFAPLSRHGACWYYVWQAYAAAGASTSMGSTPTALKGWEATWGKHPGDRNPPPGAAIWLGRRYDGNMDGDVFIAGPRDGEHAATDQPTYGKTGLTSISARMELCGREYLGWSDHVLDCPINLGGGLPNPPDRQLESDVFYVARKGWVALIVPAENGMLYAVAMGGQDNLGSIPLIDFVWDSSWASFRSRLLNASIAPA